MKSIYEVLGPDFSEPDATGDSGGPHTLEVYANSMAVIRPLPDHYVNYNAKGDEVFLKAGAFEITANQQVRVPLPESPMDPKLATIVRRMDAARRPQVTDSATGFLNPEPPAPPKDPLLRYVAPQDAWQCARCGQKKAKPLFSERRFGFCRIKCLTKEDLANAL